MPELSTTSDLPNSEEGDICPMFEKVIVIRDESYEKKNTADLYFIENL